MIIVYPQKISDIYPNKEVTRLLQEGELIPSSIYLVGRTALDMHFQYENDDFIFSFRSTWVYNCNKKDPITYTSNVINKEDYNTEASLSYNKPQNWIKNLLETKDLCTLKKRKAPQLSSDIPSEDALYRDYFEGFTEYLK